LVFGCLKDKALGEMAQILFPLFDRVLVTEVDSPRTASIGELMAAALSTGADAEAAADALAAVERASAATPPAGLVVVAGSVYLVGRVRAALVEARA
jgi:dihydrofolate synthase/folylpolyglutamate synthase